jgi:hypothetical protein
MLLFFGLWFKLSLIVPSCGILKFNPSSFLDMTLKTLPFGHTMIQGRVRGFQSLEWRSPAVGRGRWHLCDGVCWDWGGDGEPNKQWCCDPFGD